MDPENPFSEETGESKKVEVVEQNPGSEFSKLYSAGDKLISRFKDFYGENPTPQASQYISNSERAIRMRIAEAVIENDRSKAQKLAQQDPFIKELLDLDSQINDSTDKVFLNPEEDPRIQALQKKIALQPRRLEREILKGMILDMGSQGIPVRQLLTEIYAISTDSGKQFTNFTKLTQNYDPISFEYPNSLEDDEKRNTGDVNGYLLYEDFVTNNPKMAEAYKRYPPIKQALDRLALRQKNISKTESPDKSNTDKRRVMGSVGEIGQTVASQVKSDFKQFSLLELDDRREDLRNRPQLGSPALKDVLIGIDQSPTFAWIETSKIVGKSFENKDGWAGENEARKGRIAQVAKELIDEEGSPESIEHIFHPQKPAEQIKAIAISGPSGPMYYIEDGTHRVSASMLAGLVEIPVGLKNISYPLQELVANDIAVYDWQRKIDLGLIDGEIQDFISQNGRQMKRLIVRSEILPWIRTTSQSDLIKISKVYEGLYPGSLDHLKIPREALIDPIANNYFMAGKWVEWLQSRSSKIS